jgi:AcrR family transcriptional regulator
MGTTERRERERVETRQKILDAARELFVRHGYEATTMRAIARQIEYTPTAIYHHFRDKESLLMELCAEDFETLFDAFRRIGQIDDPIVRIERAGAAYIEFALEHPQQFAFMFMTPRPYIAEYDRKGDTRGDPTDDAYAFLRQAVVEAIAAGQLRPELKDPDEVAQILWAGVHGIVAIRHAKAEGHPFLQFTDPRATGARMRDVLLRGLLRDPVC